MTAPIKPMLCHDAKDVGFPEPADQWVLEGKFDGWRTLVHRSGNSVGLFGGRNGASYTGKVPYIEQAVASVLPPNSIVDGELIAPSMKCGDVQTVMRANGEHRPSAFSPHLTLVVFDVVLLNGSDVKGLPWTNRRALLEMVQWPAHTYLSPVGEATRENHLRMLNLKLEGSVLKRRTSLYVPGVRSHDWLKLKAIESIDGQIIAVLPGEGAGNRHEMGAFQIAYVGGGPRITTTIKIPDQRTVDAATADPQSFIGRWVEVAHNGVMDSGKLRHPRFFRWREDREKPAPAPKPRKPRATNGRSAKKMRAYHLMGTDKLRACLVELNNGYGDAYQRVQSGQYAGDLTDHIRVATEAARKKGLL